MKETMVVALVITLGLRVSANCVMADRSAECDASL